MNRMNGDQGDKNNDVKDMAYLNGYLRKSLSPRTPRLPRLAEKSKQGVYPLLIPGYFRNAIDFLPLLKI